MSRINDFSKETKDLLAKRAGYRCSFLGCGAPCYGPSDESDHATSSSGMACHIASASKSKPARRYIPSMSSEQVRDIKNGIWLCYSHGKLIDTDETRFSVEVLRKWKEIAENVARIMVERNCEYKEALSEHRFIDLVTQKVSIDGVGRENEVIGNVLFDSCITVSWGKEITNVVRDFVIEHTRNAFCHGKATEVELQAIQNRLIIKDNGSEYYPRDMLKTTAQTGGTIAIRTLLENHGTNLILSTERSAGLNITSIGILRTLDDIMAITPCSHKITYEEFRKGNFEIRLNETCNEVFIVLPTYVSPSDVFEMKRKFVNLEHEQRPVTFITTHLSKIVLQMLQDNYPQCKFIQTDH